MSLIELQGAINVRDLGGFVAADGRSVRPGRLLRGDSLHKLTDADVARLTELGVRTVIDFRSPEEIEGAGPDRSPVGAWQVELPVAGGNLGLTSAALRGVSSGQQADMGGGRATDLMREINRHFVSWSEYRAAFSRALHIIAAPDSGPTLFHCSAGKDRTGWMAAIVLTTVGVPRAEVIADYLATNRYVGASYEAWLVRATEEGIITDPDSIRALLFQDQSYLEAAFDEVELRYGSFERFLSEGLGFGFDERDALCTNLLA
ncbi:tyrosine-protein phosphatase [Nocardia salmonicida]|uniref:tyrosine-protein phosphatase n=1 Tax=Nocardia salmonicida TaxID=53431 RepID=UPI0037BA2C9F